MSYDPKNFKYQNGLNTTAAYQVSGIPFATGSLDLEASSGNATKFLSRMSLDGSRLLTVLTKTLELAFLRPA